MFFIAPRKTDAQLGDVASGVFNALRALKDPEQARVAVLFDAGMDSAAYKLSEMSLRYPKEIDRTHYNILIRVRDYRKQYGRIPGRLGDTNYLGVDKKVEEAIAYLESIHDMKDWVPYKFDLETGKVKGE